MVTSHSNSFAHQMLICDGAYVHTHVEAELDDGDVENGPSGNGHDCFDLYEGDSHYFIMDRSGLIIHCELIDWDAVRFYEGMQD